MLRFRLGIILSSLLFSLNVYAGVVEQFWIGAAQPDQYSQVSASLVYDGRLARIWVDVRDTGRIGPTAVAAIARALDIATPRGSRNPSRGIIENVQDVFGSSPERFKRGGKDDFLLTDLRNRAEGVTMLGTFMSKDQRPTSEQPHSNERNILYIDSREGLANLPALLGTIAHEYQHLIHFGENPHAEQFFNEGCSELASLIAGYGEANGEYLANTNVPLMQWGGPHSAGLEADYQRGMSLMLYLYEQFGDRFIRAFVSSPAQGVERIADGMQRAEVASAKRDWRGVLRDFALANYLQTEGAGATGFRQRLDTTRSVHEASLTVGAVHGKGGESAVRLAPFGSSFHLYDHPGGMRLRVAEGIGFSAQAILYYDGRPTVVDLVPGREQIIGDEVNAPDRVVLTFVSLSTTSRDVRWQVQGGGSSVATADIADQTFSTVEVIPNPTTGSAMLAFETAVGGPLRLDLYTSTGERAATVVDGVVVNPGRYELRFDTGGLASGTYLTRLIVGNRVATRQVMVAPR